MMSVFKSRLTQATLVFIVLAVAVALAAQHADVGARVDRGIAFFREAGAGPFFIAMAVLPAAGVPLSPFTMAAGPVFGPTMGVGNVIACAILAVSCNVALSYWIAARALRPLVERLARWLGYTVPQLPAGTAWEVTLLMRIIPGPPFFLQSYLLGLARVPFGIYMLISTLVPATYIVGIILAGDALMRGDWRGLAVAGALIAGAGVAIYRLRKRLSPVPRAV